VQTDERKDRERKEKRVWEFSAMPIKTVSLQHLPTYYNGNGINKNNKNNNN